MTRRSSLALALALLAGSLHPAAPARAEEPTARPFLHGLFRDHMVLQCDVPAPVWGWTEPGKRVTVEFQDRRVEATADESGRWMAKVGPFPAGGPYTLTVSGPETVTLKDVLVGDVWICSGQSNMEWGMNSTNNAKEEIASADKPQIRLYTVPKRVSAEPQANVDAKWEVCSPESVANFSAVGYFFGRTLNDELKVPIGLIHTSWGGTVAEAWTSAEALNTMEDFRRPVADFARKAAEQKAGKGDFAAQLARWWRENDPGTAAQPGWADPAFDDASWKTMDLPQKWEGAGLPDFDGVVWFRRTFDLPESWAGKDLVLHLGPIDDIDTTWVNGTEVGSKENWTDARDYRVPAGLLKPGRNVIAVRVLDTSGNGGFHGRCEEMAIAPRDDSSASPIALAGDWRYRAGAPLAKLSAPPKRINSDPNVVTVLYNGMIAPLAPFAVKGATWYQGESNAGRAAQYRTLLPTMIRDWRSRFGVGDFPFLIVQLANFMQRHDQPTESAWAELREAQALTARDLPKTGLAVAIDIGEANDIHPRNKQDVGKRLAQAALAIAYGKSVEPSGPTFRSMEVEGSSVRVRFDHVGQGLVAKGGEPLKGFAVAGPDKHFEWADAKIDGDSVVVSSPKVERPTIVRYAWADNPECNLASKDGLPAVPFRTDAPAR